MSQKNKEVSIPKSDLVLYTVSPLAFIKSGHIMIEDATRGRWVNLDPWQCQLELVHAIHTGQKVACLKSRQLGVTWVCLVYILWRMLFQPISRCAIFSLTGGDAKEALKRLKGMYKRLPHQLSPYKVTKSDMVNGIFQLSHPDGSEEGSIVYSLPGSRGEGMTLDTILFDEAGRMSDYEGLMGRVMPAIEDSLNQGTGRVMAVGIFDKEKRNTGYLSQIRMGLENRDGWSTRFFPWSAHPRRNREWFIKTKAEMLETHETDDVRKQQYPETIEEALSLSESDRLISEFSLKKMTKLSKPVYQNGEYVGDDDIRTYQTIPDIPTLKIYHLPDSSKEYVATADPAGGGAKSDYSVTMIAEKSKGVQVAVIAGKFDPSIHSAHSYRLCQFYNNCPILPERNNHGLAFIYNFKEIDDARDKGEPTIKVIEGIDNSENARDPKLGWLQSRRWKEYMFAQFKKYAREADEPIVIDKDTSIELGQMVASTLACPEIKGKNRMYDDKAIAMALIPQAIALSRNKVSSTTI